MVIYYAIHEKRGEIVNITNIYAKAKYEAKCSTLNLAKKKKKSTYFSWKISPLHVWPSRFYRENRGHHIEESIFISLICGRSLSEPARFISRWNIPVLRSRTDWQKYFAAGKCISVGYERPLFYTPPSPARMCKRARARVYSCSFFREIVQADALKMAGSV